MTDPEALETATESSRFSLLFTLVLVAVCAIPAVLQGVGVDFEVKPRQLDPTQLRSSEALFNMLRGEFLASALRWGTAFACFLTGLLCLIHYRNHREPLAAVIGLGLWLGAAGGVVDALVANQLIYTVDHPNAVLPLLGPATRSLLPLMLGLGGLTVLLHGRIRPDSPLFPILAFGTAGIAGGAFLVLREMAINPDIVQGIYPDGKPFVRPYEAVPLALYLAPGALLFPLLFRFFPNHLTQALLLCVIPGVAAEAHLVMSGEGPHDSHFMAGLFLNLVVALTFFTGMVLHLQELSRSKVAAVGDLRPSRMKGQARREPTGGGGSEARKLFDMSLDMMCIAGTDGFFKRVNKAFTTNLGYTEEELLQSPFAEFVHPDDRADTAAELRKLESGAVTLRFDNRYRTKHGEWRWLSWTARPDTESGLVYAVARDTTDQLATERVMHRLQLAVDQSSDGIAVTDVSGKFQYVNPAWMTMHGYAKGETEFLKGAPAKVFHTAEQYEKEVTPFWEELRETGSQQAQIGHKRKDGSTFPAWVSSSLLHDEQGEVIGVVSVARDITDQERHARELSEAKEAAEAASRLKSEFLAKMSHELRTPLNSVIGFAKILLKNKRGNLKEKDLTFLQRIHRNGIHLLDVINELLDLSKIEAGKLHVEKTTVVLNDLVTEVAGQFESQLASRDIALRAMMPPTPVTLVTDEKRLRQVLINLMGNAVKFTEGGSITVGIEVNPQTGDPISLQVTDTGPGIEPDKLHEIFDAFQQGEAGTARRYEGTGLGLSISRSLCELMGYSLGVESVPGKGSTFAILFEEGATLTRLAEEVDTRVHVEPVTVATPPLPAEPPTPPQEQPATQPAVQAVAEIEPTHEPADEPVTFGTSRDERILALSDDDACLARLVQRIEECGFHLVDHGRGEQGLARARSQRPDLLVVDLGLPNLEGWQTLRRIKLDPELRLLPTVVVCLDRVQGLGTCLGPIDLLQNCEAARISDLMRCNLQAETGRFLLAVTDTLVRHRTVRALDSLGITAEVAHSGMVAFQTLEGNPPDLLLLELATPGMHGESLFELIRRERTLTRMPLVLSIVEEREAEDTERLRAYASSLLQAPTAWSSLLNDSIRSLLDKVHS